METTPDFVPLAEACERIGISYRHGCRLAKTGAFPVTVTRIGNRWVVSRHLLDVFARTGVPNPTPVFAGVDPLAEPDEWAETPGVLRGPALGARTAPSSPELRRSTGGPGSRNHDGPLPAA